MKRLILARLVAVMAVAILTLPLSVRAQDVAPSNKVATAAHAPAANAKPAEPALRIVNTENTAEPVVSMVFDETPLSDVIKAFRDATGANIISGGSNLQTTVSIRLDNVPWRKGLSSILDPQGLQLLEQPAGSGIFVVTAKTTEIPKVTRTFELNYAKAADMASLFKSTLGTTGIATPFPSANVVIVTATDQQLSECDKIIKAIDKPSPQVYIEVRFAELSASASKKLGLKWDSLGGDGWGVHLDSASLSISKGVSTSKTRGQDVSEENSNSSSSSSDTSDSLANDVRSITQDSALGSSSSRSLTSSPTLTSSRTHTFDRGFTGSLSMDAFALTLNAFEQMDGVSIFSNPKIIVSNEKEAVVDMTTKEPNLSITTTRSGSNSEQIDIAAKLEAIPGEKGDKDGNGKGLFAGEVFFSYGITLKVTPRISPTGLITLTVEPSISTLDSYYEFTGVSSDTPTPRYPIIEMQKMQTIFTMQSGSTAVIGGLSKTTESNVDSGIPLLRNIPWIGPRVFGWKSRAKEQKEIIIFVTVGLADPVGIPQDIGMPKNAILGRDLLNGKLKEPGDRTKEEVLNVNDPKPVKRTAAKASPAAASAENGAAQTTAVEPLLKNQ